MDPSPIKDSPSNQNLTDSSLGFSHILNLKDSPETVKAALMEMDDYDPVNFPPDQTHGFDFMLRVVNGEIESSDRMIYGRGGWNRYWVHEDGRVFFLEQAARREEDIPKAKSLNFGLHLEWIKAGCP